MLLDVGLFQGKLIFMRITMDAVQEARRNIAGIAVRTPLVRLTGEVWLKLESLQPIGSFKIRGAANAMARAPRERLAKGVLTASAGNMAQGVAYCAGRMGIPATVVTPDTAPETKLKAIERLGGKIIKVPFDQWWRTFEERSFPGVDAAFIHAFDDPDVMAGNGTIGLEILEDLRDVEAMVIPWGGGGLACGIASVIKARKPGVQDLRGGIGDGGSADGVAGGGPTGKRRLAAILYRRDRGENGVSLDVREGQGVDRRDHRGYRWTRQWGR